MKANELPSAPTHQKTFPFSHQTDPPLVKLEVGTNPIVEGNVVSEGADVYFECNIKANPWVYRVAWRQNVSKYGEMNFSTSGNDFKL